MKERYLQFQIKWQRHCSYLLVDKNYQLSQIGLHPSDPLAAEVVPAQSKWNNFCFLHSLILSNAKKFLIVFCCCMYDELLRQCHTAIGTKQQEDVVSSEDTEDVYYRFGGATLCSMLHNRYDKIKVCSSQQNNFISQELALLQCISIHKKEDKNDVPDYLKYRDEGNMYFPCAELLPFLKAVDVATNDKVNDVKFNHLGSNMLTIVELLHGDANLLTLFLSALASKMCDLPFTVVDTVFKEMVRKLAHIRVQEYIDSYKHKGAAQKGSATLAGQNLCDSLLTHHVNLKTKQ